MKEINIFAENVEEEAMKQFENAMTLDCIVKGALMPDAHTGYTLPIGAVVASDGVIFPSFVGYDIGCGMCAISTSFSKSKIIAYSVQIFDGIYKSVPVGFNHNQRQSLWNYDYIPHTKKLKEIMDKNGLKQLCSLGSGNHFVEIGYDETDKVWIIVHSGSRGIGHAVASHYMRLASGDGKAREGLFGFNVDSIEGKDYIDDMNFCLAFALENREQIINRVCNVIKSILVYEKVRCGDTFINRNHNHAEYKDGLWIHRKGATHAELGMMGVIPGNMRDGSFIVEGLGNPKSLYSSSHGAGRILGRKEAQRTLTMDNFTNSMVGITAKVDEKTIDESPMAYKNIFEVMDLQKELVKIKHYIKPLINIKG